MQDPRIILGIESSCDDTAAAIVTAERQILSTVVWEQDTLHADFGGVVPEVAARAHAERIDDCVAAALDQSGLTLADVSLVAVTAGPGLIGGVFAGVMFAKGLAAASGIDLVAVNHLAGHALTPRLTDNVAFPYLMLLVSGGHCQFLAVEGARRFTRLGGTIDDAPGEAFDKIARLLGLPQPGGPAIERAAAAGEPTRFALPRPLLTRPGCDMSFSGLKTATRREIDGLVARQGGLYRQDVADICAGFQAAVAEILTSRTQSALAMFAERLNRRPHVLAVAGGVAANATIRQGLAGAAGDVPFIAPPVALCTDNGAMIAWAGFEAHSDGQRDDLGFEARPRWPLDTDAAPILGSGKRGPKA